MIHWVGWLAAVPVRQGQTIFHLENLQTKWLDLRPSKVVGLVVGLVVGPIVGLGFGLVFGGDDVIQHWVLRFLLWRKRFAPLRYVRFLAAERVFLRKVGGGYIFIHRMLMEHFAKLYEKETGAASKAQSTAG